MRPAQEYLKEATGNSILDNLTLITALEALETCLRDHALEMGEVGVELDRLIKMAEKHERQLSDLLEKISHLRESS